MTPGNLTDLLATARAELYSAVIGDICDEMGLRHQFLPPYLRPLQPADRVPTLCGLAMPVLEADIFAEPTPGHPTDGRPFGRMLDAVDDVQRDEVYICAGASHRYALVGELMATAMKARGAAGVVTDGYVRDTTGLLELDFPVFSLGSYSQDQRGRGLVVDFRVPIEIAGIRVEPGDILFGDVDGVLVIPQTAAEEVFARSLEKARGEKTVKRALEEGMSVTDAFTKYGIM